MAQLPGYVTAAKPVPQNARAAWYKNTAQTYAGIMLWFAFWQMVVSGSATPGGSLAAGLGIALLGLLIAALFCHFLTYLVPGMLGMKTGLPLYIVGTSTYGVRGGFIMPGFLMGALQFGWLAVNAYFSSLLICIGFDVGVDKAGNVAGPTHGIIASVFIILAVIIGIKGIQYVARVATFVPLIPLGILIFLLVKTAGGIGSFDQDKLIEMNKAGLVAAADSASAGATEAKAKVAEATDEEKEAAVEASTAAAKSAEEAEALAEKKPLSVIGVLFFLSLYVVGFFATAGAAGADFGMNNRNARDVHLGGLVGIVGATFFAGAAAIFIVAGAYGSGMITPELQAELNPVKLMEAIVGGEAIIGERITGSDVMLLLLAASSFAPACFPAFIAANSFKTTMPKFGMVAVAIGTLAAIALAVSGLAGKAVPVFMVVGASFGPICGAMMADYLLSGFKWAGPRAGFNMAGWISWAVGFYLGAVDLVAANVPALACLKLGVPCPPMAALIVGFVLYIVLAKLGLQGKTLKMPAGE